jgi:hypothetical protein
MTQRTINLYDDLELLYYLDSDYVDFGSNTISDRSGHQRDGDISGGLQFNDSGVRSFRSAEYDGSDDSIVVADAGPLENFPEQFTILQVASPDRQGVVVNQASDFNGYHTFARPANDGGVVHGINSVNDDPGFASDESTAAAIGPIGIIEVDQTPNNSYTQTIYKGSERVAVKSTESELRTSAGFNAIGAGANQDRHNEQSYDGGLAVVAIWQRLLTDAEKDALSRLTATRQQSL